MKQYATLEDTVYFWVASNDTSGSGDDGTSPVFDVRLAGAAAGAAPVYSGSGALLTHGAYPDGCHEIAIPATAGNGFTANNTYAVFFTLLADSQNPTGFIGSFDLKPVEANAVQISGDAAAADNLELQYDTTGLSGDTFPASQSQVNANETKIDALQSDMTAVRAKTDNLPGSIPKNVALNNLQFLMVDAVAVITPAPGLTVTAKIQKDDGVFANCTNSAVEISLGWYRIDLTQAEMNADAVALVFTATGAAQRSISFRTDS